MDKIQLGLSAMGLSKLKDLGAQSSAEDQKWRNFNYPPKFELIHYSLTGYTAEVRRTVQGLNLNMWLMLIVQLINLVNNFGQATATECKGTHALSILYSLLSKFSL